MCECVCSGGGEGQSQSLSQQGGLGVCQGKALVTLLLLSCVLELFCFRDRTKIR